MCRKNNKAGHSHQQRCIFGDPVVLRGYGERVSERCYNIICSLVVETPRYLFLLWNLQVGEVEWLPKPFQMVENLFRPFAWVLGLVGKQRVRWFGTIHRVFVEMLIRIFRLQLSTPRYWQNHQASHDEWWYFDCDHARLFRGKEEGEHALILVQFLLSLSVRACYTTINWW